ncbi:hypothetical protein EBR66_03940 [bacterium]|nr:hypothetical protein [bacterium]
MPNAGVDESNADGKIILLPKDSYHSAMKLRERLRTHFGLTNFGILITDSRTSPLHAGTMGVAMGYVGFEGIRNYIGTPDIFGRPLAMTRSDVADALAASAVVCMGEGKEQQPLALITDAPVFFTDTVNTAELAISIEDDMYRPLFENAPQNK